MKKAIRWAPALVAPVLVAAAAVAVPSVADATTTAPATTAQSVLALVAKSKDAHYSGTVQQSSNLGLPQLPSTANGSSDTSSASSILDLLTAPHSARVFVDGTSRQRVQVLDSLAERDVIHNGTDLWTWDSKKNAATHITLPSKTSESTSTAVTPAELADRLIKDITPTTKVSVATGSHVAGRSVYQLELSPKSSGTLVSDVTLSVDTVTGLPLEVTVDARGQKDPAVSVGFSSIDFSTPSAKTFDFRAPSGATVTTKSFADAHPAPHAHGTPPAHSVTGTGWASIVELPAGSLGSGTASLSSSQSQLLNELTTPVNGGRALQTSLVSVLLTSDGRVFAGAVPVASLEAAAQ